MPFFAFLRLLPEPQRWWREWRAAVSPFSLAPHRNLLSVDLQKGAVDFLLIQGSQIELPANLSTLFVAGHFTVLK